jgi:hypothetical protein
MAGSQVTPDLPDGFVLDQAHDHPPLPEGFQLDGASAPEEAPQSYGINGVARGIMRGLTEAGKGIANSLDKLPPDWENAHLLAKTAKSYIGASQRQMEIADDQYGKSHSQAFNWKDPSTYREIPYALSETLPGPAVSLAMPELRGTGFLASEVGQHYGNALDQRMANQPAGAKPSTEDQAAALLSTGAQAGLAKFGMGKLSTTTGAGAGLLGGVRTAATDVAKATTANAGAGAVGDVVDQLGRTAGTAKGANVDLDEVMNAGVMGGAQGAALRGAKIPGDVVNSVRMAKFGGENAKASADYANRLTNSGEDITSDKGAFKAHDIAKEILKSDIDRARDALGGEDGLLTRNGDLDKQVDASLTRLKTGQVLKPEDLKGLSKGLGDQGAELTHLIRTANVGNMVKKFGNFDSNDKSHQGGVAGSKLGKFLNPLHFITSPGSHGAATNLVLTGLGMAQLAHTFGAGGLGLGVGAAAAVRPVLHGLDAALGLRHPTAEFVSRFGGSQGKNFTPPTAPVKPGPAEQQGPQLPDAVRAQIMAKQYLDKQAAADRTAMFKDLPAAEKVDREFTKAREANQPPAPSVADLQKLLKIKEGDAKALAKATATKTKAAGTIPSVAPYEGPSVNLNMPGLGAGGPPTVQPNYPAVIPPKVLAKISAMAPFNGPSLGSNMPGLGSGGPPTVQPRGFSAEPLVRPPQAPRDLPPMAPFNGPSFAGPEMAPSGPPTVQPPGFMAVGPKVSPKGPEAPSMGPAHGLPSFADNMPGLPSGGPPSTSPRGYADIAKSLEKVKAAQEGPQKAQGQAKAPEATTPAAKAEKPASEAPSKPNGKDSDEGPTITVNHAGYSVERPAKGIKNEKAYRAAVEKNLRTRASFAKDLKGVLPADEATHVDALINRLGGRSMGKDEAQIAIQDFIDEHVSEKRVDTVFPIVKSHFDKLMDTYPK